MLQSLISKIEKRIPRELKQKVASIGHHNLVTNYQQFDLIKAAQYLGTKLSLINKEHKNIMNGLNCLEDLTKK